MCVNVNCLMSRVNNVIVINVNAINIPIDYYLINNLTISETVNGNESGDFLGLNLAWIDAKAPQKDLATVGAHKLRK